ncbi:hypothetical protein N9Y00_07890 [Tateyamaria sp.]|nr:hypothetical protein [Tateyamaria sp.]
MASIQDAINQAQDNAAAVLANEAAAADATTGTGIVEGYTSPTGQVQTFAKPTMTSVAASTGLIPRNTRYLKPTEFGMKIGKNKDMLQDFEAEILLVDDEGFQLKHTVRFGNPAQYLSSYDGLSCNKGGTWGDALAKARFASPDAAPYYAAEIKLVLTKGLKLKEETLKPGTIIGYDTSAPSRFGDWSDFWEAAVKAGAAGKAAKVKVISREVNHNGNIWGTVVFELL